MSLLMEALRKAEEAKRKIQNEAADPANAMQNRAGEPTQDSNPSADNGFTLEEMEPAVTADYIVDNFLSSGNELENSAPQTSEPRLPSSPGRPSRASVEELQNYLETTPELEETPPLPRKDVPPQRVSPAVQQRAASAVFAAKQKPVQSHAMRNTLFVLFGIFVAYGVWEVVSSSGSSLMIDPALLDTDITNRSLSDELIEQPATQSVEQRPAPVADIAEQAEPPAANTEITTAPVQQTETPPNPSPPAETIPDTSPSAAPSLATLTAGIIAMQEAPSAATAVSPAMEDATANPTVAVNPVQVLEVTRSKRANNNNQQLLDAYARLQAGDVVSASTLYQQVLEQIPNNRDALLGSAAIALREGNIARAREYYSRLMQLNPKDPLARTGLLQTIQDIDPLQYEQELQRLLQQFPNVAPLAFALGNVYASQQRWNEAQSAYFDAFLFARQSNETAINPDYAYNLAVSLEQINQPEAALDYYLQAQTLARAVTPGFDMQALTRRISFLEQSRP
jgi:Flp pilus assembly protein TadD